MIKHIAFIMDGNRRWAQSRGLLKVLGHKEGLNRFEEVADFCIKKGMKYISFYTFSVENLKRSEAEKNYLFDLFIKESDKLLKELKDRGARARFIGDRSLFPENLVTVCEKIERETCAFDSLYVNFLFCYGGRQEILSGVKNILAKVKSGELLESEITEDIFYKNLWSGDFPEPDLVVRTGGQIRLSNFLLYQSAYSELCFLDCMWPEINEEILNKVLLDYEVRKRNFGK
ncbi:MAG: undecaprenyl pyrophosphate synthase [uncultured bacterium]|jgi:undecaprenyl diphosphate synthase|nr:MAG: undecaprenyl pyrophosphate synthase [uncultured bacterium]KKP29362.1 MAG: Isoprenyl transferase [candidate division TM6 bacterium GW2011_GWF2_30_66]